MIEVNDYLLFRCVDLSSEAFEVKLYLKIIRSMEDDLRVDKVQNVLLVADAWSIVPSFDFIEGGVGPILLVAGVDDSVGAGDD